MKFIHFLFLFLSFGKCCLIAQTTKQELFDNLDKMAGVYYAYPSNEIVDQTVAPKGYEPFYISHFGRHGSRYLINDSDYKWILDLFRDADGQNALTDLGVDVLARIEKIWIEAQGRGGDLSPLGLHQQRGIAERMYRSYPEVFSDGVEISARSTLVVRCVLSMDGFSERLKELNPRLQITREASNKYMNYLNFHTREAVDFRSQKDTWRKEYNKFEKAHMQGQRLIHSLFCDSTYIQQNVDSGSLMFGLYRIASVIQNMDTKISFYDLFKEEELFGLWQVKNYSLYVEYANSALNKGIMMENAKPVLSNILSSAKDAIDSKKKGATLRFAHDGNIIPLATLLHLQDCYKSVSKPSEFYKAWSDFKVAPMAGNIQIIFFRNNNSDDVVVKFLLNEREILVPPIKSEILPYYHWKDVEYYYKSLLES
ncbi:multiple inositol polyphosphate histidine phosphatase 1 [Bacteroidales bacterium]|nr:multiple inositol polyphosphate histidine phosphatase 1 [Bacteroidales bacterium]